MSEDASIQIERFEKGQLSIEEQRNLAADLGSLTDMKSQATLISFLGNEDPITRYNAIIALGFDRGVRAVSSTLTRMLESDPDEDCRSASAAALGQMFQNTNDQSVLQVLGSSALHDSDKAVSRSAYKAALIVHGVSPEEHLALLRDEALAVNREKVGLMLSKAT